MTRIPSAEELDRLLAELPRESASAGFSHRVLAGLDQPQRPPTGRRLLLAATGVAVSLALGLWLRPQAAPEIPLADNRALEQEHRLLMEELEALKLSLRDSQQAPVLYLGGDESLDLVLDLGPIWQGEPAAGIRPAVYGGAERPVQAGDRRPGDRR